mgnify:CR=1 FL=1
MKKILVVGGAGYVGTRLSNYLFDKGYDVNVIDKSNNSVLAYNSSTLKYEIKTLPVIFGGNF